MWHTYRARHRKLRHVVTFGASSKTSGSVKANVYGLLAVTESTVLEPTWTHYCSPGVAIASRGVPSNPSGAPASGFHERCRYVGSYHGGTRKSSRPNVADHNLRHSYQKCTEKNSPTKDHTITSPLETKAGREMPKIVRTFFVFAGLRFLDEFGPVNDYW